MSITGVSNAYTAAYIQQPPSTGQAGPQTQAVTPTSPIQQGGPTQQSGQVHHHHHHHGAGESGSQDLASTLLSSAPTSAPTSSAQSSLNILT